MDESNKVDRKKILALARWRQWFSALSVTSICFSLGTVLAWRYGPEVTQGLTQSEIGLLVAAPTIGGMIGGPLGGASVEVVGRRKTMIAFILPVILGWLLVGINYNFIMAFMGRFLTGFGCGAGLVTAIVYVSDFAEDCRRGILLCQVQLMLLTGYLFIDIFESILAPKSLAYTCGMIPALSLSMTVYVPETARFLVKKRRLGEAAKSVAWFRATDAHDVTAERVQAISRSVERSRMVSPWRQILSRPMLKPFLIVSILILMYELSGFNTVLSHRQLLLYKPGIVLSKNLLLAVVGIVVILITALAALMIDSLGRRTLLILSGALTTSALVTLGTYYYITYAQIVLPGQKPSYLWIPLGSCLVYLFGFSLGIGPIPWVFMGEILPPNSKGYCLIPLIFYWFFHNLLTDSEWDATKHLDIYWKFWLPSVLCFCGTLFLLCTLPETRKKRMEKIEEFFATPPVKSVLPKAGTYNGGNGGVMMSESTTLMGKPRGELRATRSVPLGTS